MSDTGTQIKYPQMVRIKNEGDSVFEARYAGERYRLVPGADTFIPWDAACLWFGHPYAVDVPGDKRKRYRTDELKRLYVKYGIYEHHDKREAMFPKVSVWDVATGERFTTVIDDPDGRNLNPAAITQADNESLQRQLAVMQEQMAMLQAQMAQGRVNEPVTGETVAVEASSRPELRDDGEEDSVEANGVESLPADTPTRPKAVARS